MNIYHQGITDILCLGLTACAPILASGGPNGVKNQRVLIRSQQIQPMIKDSPQAVNAVKEIREREMKSSAINIVGILGLLTCQIPTIKGEIASVDYLLLTCGSSIVFSSVALYFAPKKKNYGDIFRVYNAERPATPWTIPALDVEPAPKQDQKNTESKIIPEDKD